MVTLGVRLKSEGPRDLNGELVRSKLFPTNDYVEYVLPGQLGKGLAHKVSSYFNRPYGHFCLHRQTPSSGQAAGLEVIKNGRAIYFTNPIFSECDNVASHRKRTTR